MRERKAEPGAIVFGTAGIPIAVDIAGAALGRSLQVTAICPAGGHVKGSLGLENGAGHIAGTNLAAAGLHEQRCRGLNVCSRSVSGPFQMWSTQASREASHDCDGATGQADDVVSDGADKMAGETPCLQPLKSRPLGAVQKRGIPHPFPAHPLGVPGEVLQMLRIRMHDVALERPGSENGLLRARRQSIAEPVFGLVSLLLAANPGDRIAPG